MIVAAYEYIDVVLVGLSKSGKTRIYDVYTKPDRGREKLGTIRWFGRWRQYAFFPRDDTLYSAGCLDDIAKFIREDARTVKVQRLQLL